MRAEARRLVTEICAWFTQGFDSSDQKEARSFAEQL
jgi:hypothetical protein